MGFLIRLESVASPESPKDAIALLVALPAVLNLPLGVGVIADVNGVDVFAWRHTDPDVAFRDWRANLDRKHWAETGRKR